MLLGVNIDHVATLRQARGTIYPEPVKAALLAEDSGADSITIHLREDRRHIQDADVHLINNSIRTRLNLEMAVTEEMLSIALEVMPADVCLVPEKRAELTTEGGLDVAGNAETIRAACGRLAMAGIRVSLFIDADEQQIFAAKDSGASVIEIHTGSYADAQTDSQRQLELERVQRGCTFARSLGLIVNAGHGLNLANVAPVAAIPEIVELNIGHSLVADAVFVGLGPAITAMKSKMLESSTS